MGAVEAIAVGKTLAARAGHRFDASRQLVGEGFYEMPGLHHRISDNASDSNPASLLAVFVVDSKDKPLTIPDKK